MIIRRAVGFLNYNERPVYLDNLLVTEDGNFLRVYSIRGTLGLVSKIPIFSGIGCTDACWSVGELDNGLIGIISLDQQSGAVLAYAVSNDGGVNRTAISIPDLSGRILRIVGTHSPELAVLQSSDDGLIIPTIIRISDYDIGVSVVNLPVVNIGSIISEYIFKYDMEAVIETEDGYYMLIRSLDEHSKHLLCRIDGKTKCVEIKTDSIITSDKVFYTYPGKTLVVCTEDSIQKFNIETGELVEQITVSDIYKCNNHVNELFIWAGTAVITIDIGTSRLKSIVNFNREPDYAIGGVVEGVRGYAVVHADLSDGSTATVYAEK